jgi:O-acetyl-ADP-ribose deacetylase (regulator of RNase III)
MKEIEGDLTCLMKEFKFQVMAHGCNCFNTMGAGIAKTVRAQFPEAWEADQKTVKGDINKLGNYTYADYRWNNQFAFRVINAYTQFGHNPLDKPFDYEAFTLCMRKINFNHKGMTIGLPLIGAGLAGGNWGRIQDIIEAELKDMDVTIVKFVPYGAENANKINQLLKGFEDGQTK